jgi:hypothetical protein
MALSSSNAVRQLSDGNSQGTVLGKSSTDTIGFYGVTTPVAQFSLSTTAQQSLSSGALVSSIAIVLNNLGLINCTSVGA